LIFLSLAPIGLAQAPQPKDNNLTTIKLYKEMPITEFLDLITKTTGKPLLYDPNGSRIKGATLGAGFSHQIPKDRLFDTMRAILQYYEMTLVPIGPKGYEIYLVVDSRSTNNLIKNKAIYVDYRDLESYADQDGLYISCAVPIHYIENLTVLRTALSTMVSPAGIGRVHEVPGSQSIIIMDYAPTVAAIARLIKQMDVQPPGKKLVMRFIELEYAYADDVADILSELVSAQRQAVNVQRRGNATMMPPNPEPRIMAYDPKNALVISATEDDFNLIKDLVDQFDKPGQESSQVEVVRLNHVEAQDIADTLSQVLEGMGGVLPGAGPVQPRNVPGRPRNPNIRRTGGSQQQNQPHVVPDTATNSLILAADRKTISALKDIISQLDMPNDQVLIEATLISLAKTDNFNLGVELVGIDRGGLNSNTASGFGVTNFGLSTFEDTDNDGIPDINVPTSLTASGGGVVAGIFRAGGIPILLQAIQTLNQAKIVSMPSVVTYDNEEATLTSQNEQPVGTSTELSSGSQTTGFTGFEAAGVTLNVSPHISADNYLRLQIHLEVSSFSGDAPGINLPPPKLTNTIDTVVALPDAHTVVMGGLISEQDTVTESKVPLLGDIPGLGFLFKNKSRNKVKSVLFIFVTPHILRQHGTEFEDLHRQSWIAKMTADELIGAIEFHNAHFKNDPRFKKPEDADIASIDVSSLVDAGRFQQVPAEQAIREIQELRKRAAR